MSKTLVYKDNALINASYNLDLVEHRLILLAIVEARRTNTPNTQGLTIHADSYMSHFGVNRNTAYKSLQNACDALYERRFSYQKLTKKGNVEHVRSRWVQNVSYVKNEALVRITFSVDVIPLITNLEKHFTRYELALVSGLTSQYAVRLYEQIIAWRETGKTPLFEIKDFRSKLGVEDDEYERMHHFKARVLDIAIKQINEHTDIIVEYEQEKKGRSITGFRFNFKLKNPSRDPNTIDMFSGSTDAELGKKPKRKKITEKEADAMAHRGEYRHELYKRLSPNYIIIKDK